MRKSSKVMRATKRTRHDIRPSIMPGSKKISTHQHFLCEPRNLTVCISMRRMRGLTNAFSQERLDLKWARNEFADYNFVGQYIPAETHSRFGERIDRSCLEDSETYH